MFTALAGRCEILLCQLAPRDDENPRACSSTEKKEKKEKNKEK